MRKIAFLLIILSEVAILLLEESALNSSFLSLLSTLTVVIVIAFLFSSLLRKIGGLSIKNNYLISGGLGLALGIIYFSWAQANIPQVVNWIYHWGTMVLLGLIFLGALILFQKPKN